MKKPSIKEMVTDEIWAEIEIILPLQAQRWLHKYHNRKHINAILWVLFIGGSWRQLPQEFGAWNSAFRRYKRWQANGTWRKIRMVLEKYPEFRSPLPTNKYSGIKGKRKKALKAKRTAKNSKRLRNTKSVKK